ASPYPCEPHGLDRASRCPTYLGAGGHREGGSRTGIASTDRWYAGGVPARRPHFNEVRPHSSLGYLTPLEFKAACRDDRDEGRAPAPRARADRKNGRFTNRLTALFSS